MNRPANGLLVLLVCAQIAGCAIITRAPVQEPGVDDPAAWQARKTRMAQLQQWSMQGRAATGKLVGWSGNLNWQQRGETFDGRLAGPLGAGGFRALGTLDQVEIRTEDEIFYTDTPEALVEELLGWEFPLTGLRFWALGLPGPARINKLTVDADGLLRELEQQGWRVSYSEYREYESLLLPRKIQLDNGDNRIKVVVDRWFNLQSGD